MIHQDPRKVNLYNHLQKIRGQTDRISISAFMEQLMLPKIGIYL